MKKLQEAAQNALASGFELWASLIVRCSIFVCFLCLVLYVYLAAGNRFSAAYETLDFPWAPIVSLHRLSQITSHLKGNESIKYGFKAAYLFVTSTIAFKERTLRIAFEAKQADPS